VQLIKDNSISHGFDYSCFQIKAGGS